MSVSFGSRTSTSKILPSVMPFATSTGSRSCTSSRPSCAISVSPMPERLIGVLYRLRCQTATGDRNSQLRHPLAQPRGEDKQDDSDTQDPVSIEPLRLRTLKTAFDGAVGGIEGECRQYPEENAHAE